MSFFRRLQALYATSKPPQAEPYVTADLAVEDLKEVYQKYEQHLVPKVLASLEKAAISRISKDDRRKIDHYGKQIRIYEKDADALAKKMIPKPNKPVDSTLSDIYVERIRAIQELKRKKANLEGTYIAELRQIKSDLKDQNPKTQEAALEDLRELCSKIRDKDNYGGMKAIKKLNDRDNVRRFLYVAEIHNQLKDDKLSAAEKGTRFIKDFNSYGRAAILGEKSPSTKTEKGRVFSSVQKILARASQLFSGPKPPAPAPKEMPVAMTMTAEEEKEGKRDRKRSPK